MRTGDRRWSVLDVGILLVAMLCVVSGGLRFRERLRGDASSEVGRYTVVLFAKEIPVERTKCLSPGETLYFETGTPLGRVGETVSDPSPLVLLESGRCYTGNASTACDLTVWVEVQGSREGDALICGDGRLLPGERMRVRSRLGDWEILVLRFE